MFKKVIVLVSLCFSFAFAEVSQSVIVSEVKANPALLDSPAAQAEMAKRGVSKSDVLSKVASANSSVKNKHTQKEVKNDVELQQKKAEANIKKRAYNQNSVFVNPLKYKQNEAILREIKIKQSVRDSKKLGRYGINFFKNRNKNDFAALPVPDYYVLSYKDVISIWIYGAKNKNFSLEINNNGNIDIPNYGPMHIVGMKFGEAKKFIKEKLKNLYLNSNVVVNISNYSTIQVNLVGDVVAPGVYNINSLSSIKELLIVAHGVNPTGTLRDVILKRNGKILASVDFYKLLQNGDDGMQIVLQPNDTVLVPKAKKIVSIDGEVNKPAKFELKPNETLKNLLQYAGGIKSNASKFGFIVQRYIHHEKVKTIEVDLKNSKNFKLLNGDRIYVYNIDKTHKESIYMYGNIVRPGERELGSNRSLKDMLKSEIAKRSLKGVFLDNTLFSYALLKRTTKDLDQKIENFNLQDVINGEKDITLQDNDEIYIFNKYNSNITPYVTISGTPVIKAGKYQYYKNIKITDLLAMAGTTSYFGKLNKIKVTTYNTKDFMPKTTIITGAQAKDYKLYPFDSVEVYDYYTENHIKTFTISGAVNMPNKYTLNKHMTLREAITVAGGFNEKAYKKDFEIVRYYIKNNERKKKLIEVPGKDIDTFVLDDYDEINIHSIPNWADRKTITIKGEVNFPGTYVIVAGDKLESVIKRAGGYTKNAFLDGAVFTRESIKKLQRIRLKQSILTLKKQAVSLESAPNSAGQGNKKIDYVALSQLLDKISAEEQTLAPIGRIAIKLDSNLTKFDKSKSNIVLKDKDTLTVPSKNDTILIAGEVMSPTAIVYQSNDANYYIEKAGGLTQRADDSNIFIIHADGSAEKVNHGWFSGNSAHIIRRGDSIIVPQELVTTTGLQLAKDISSIFYQFALTIASMHVIGVL